MAELLVSALVYQVPVDVYFQSMTFDFIVCLKFVALNSRSLINTVHTSQLCIYRIIKNGL